MDSLKYKITKRDAYKAYLLTVKPRRIYGILGVILILAGLCVCFLCLKPSEGQPKYGLAALIFGCIILVLFQVYVFPLYTISKCFKQTKGIDEEIELTVGNYSFQMVTKNSQINVPYADIYKIKSNNRYLLVFENQYICRVIPKNTQELIDAADMIEQKYLGRVR